MIEMLALNSGSENDRNEYCSSCLSMEENEHLERSICGDCHFSKHRALEKASNVLWGNSFSIEYMRECCPHANYAE
jgi:ribosomal protein S27AE